MQASIQTSIANFSYDMHRNTVRNNVGIAMLGKTMLQAGTQAGTVLQMLPPPAAANDLGGLLDTRA